MKALILLGTAILMLLGLFVFGVVFIFLVFEFFRITERIFECPVEKEKRLKAKAEKNKRGR